MSKQTTEKINQIVRERRSERVALARKVLNSPYALGVIYAALEAAELLDVEHLTRTVAKDRLLVARSSLGENVYRRPATGATFPETEEAREEELRRVMSEIWAPITPTLELVREPGVLKPPRNLG